MSAPARGPFPVPTTISPEAQALLARGVPMLDLDEPDPSDKAAWQQRIGAMSAMIEKMMEARVGSSPPVSRTEHRLTHVALYEIEPVELQVDDAAILHVHGGGFTLGGGLTAAYASYELTGLAGVRTFAVDYRMPPEAPFPAALDDTLEAYRFLIERYGADRVAFHGTSSGAALAASTILKARDEGLPLPAACAMHSPEADLTESGDSFETNDGVDGMLRRLTNSIALYADGHDLRDPYLSPLFGDFTRGFPPSLLSCGTRDLFLSNTVLMHRALRRAGVWADLQIWEAMGHNGFQGAPEDHEIVREHARFLRERLS